MSTRTPYAPTDPDYRAEATDRLRELFPAGSEVRTIVRHVSRSGMMRSISVLAIRKGTGSDPDRIIDVSGDVARVLGWRIHDTGGVVVNGCGMDMCFHLVYTLARKLYADYWNTDELATMQAGTGNTTDPGYLLTSRVL